MLTLHGFARTRTSRCLWMLEEIGAPYTHVPTPTGATGTQTEAFRALNPTGRVPVLVDGDLVLWESLAINLHLARSRGGDLGPLDAREEALMAMWTVWSAAEFEPDAHTIYQNTLFRPEGERDAAALAAAVQRVGRALGALETALADSGCLVGGRFTVADLNAHSVAYYLRGMPELIAARPALARWYQAIAARPAFRTMEAMRAAA